jgi:hypothetical protein
MSDNCVVEPCGAPDLSMNLKMKDFFEQMELCKKRKRIESRKVSLSVSAEDKTEKFNYLLMMIWN